MRGDDLRESYKNEPLNLVKEKAEALVKTRKNSNIPYSKLDPEDAEYYYGAANVLMNAGTEHKKPELAILGAQVYEVLGKKDRSLRRSIKQRLKGSIDEDTPEYLRDSIKNFIKKGINHKTIESKILNSIFVLCTIVGLFFVYPNLTGGVIGFFDNSSNIIGLVLFVLGILGVFVYNNLRR